MKHMAQLEAAGLVKHSSELKDETADVDIDFYITSVSALLKLIQVVLLSVQIYMSIICR